MTKYVTFTFVVRMDDNSHYNDERVDLSDVDDPRSLLTNDEVMFWGSEAGITEHARDLGADPSMWDTLRVEVDIENYYEGGDRVTTHVDVEVTRPSDAELADPARLDEWAYDQLFEHTGTGQTQGDSAYFLKITGCDGDERLVGREFEMGT